MERNCPAVIAEYLKETWGIHLLLSAKLQWEAARIICPDQLNVTTVSAASIKKNPKVLKNTIKKVEENLSDKYLLGTQNSKKQT